MRSLVIVAIGASVLAGCGVEQGTARPAPSVSKSQPTAATVPRDAARDMSVRLCKDLEKYGESFYSRVYGPQVLGKGTGGQITSIELAAATGVLSAIGADEGKIDGQANIMQATPVVRDRMLTLTRDAARIGQHYADAAVSGVGISLDIMQKSLFVSFPSSAVACRDVGAEPAWF